MGDRDRSPSFLYLIVMLSQRREAIRKEQQSRLFSEIKVSKEVSSTQD
jgi:hypothetical protein